MSHCTYMQKVMAEWQSLFGMAKEFELFEKQKIKANDYKKIKQVIDENADIIISRWKEHFEN